MGLIILGNCVTIGIEVDLCPNNGSVRWKEQGQLPKRTNAAGAIVSEQCPSEFLQVSEHVFTALFVMEFFIRWRATGFGQFLSPTGFADACLVWVTGVLLVWVLNPLKIKASFMRYATVFRALRLMRIARVVKNIPAFKEMWLLLRGLFDSARTLFWTVTVIMFVTYLFGILFMLFVADAEEWGQEERDGVQAATACIAVRESISGKPLTSVSFAELSTVLTPCESYAVESVSTRYFEALAPAMFTLLQVMTGDSWCEAIARRVNEVQPIMWILFVAFVAAGTLVLLNLVTAVIVDNALEISKEDEQEQLRVKRLEEAKTFRRLEVLFAEMDQDESGELTIEELHSSFEKQQVKDKFHLLDIDEGKVRELFSLLDITGDGELSLKEFVDGLTKIKKPPQSWELLKVSSEVSRVHYKVDKLIGLLGSNSAPSSPKVGRMMVTPKSGTSSMPASPGMRVGALVAQAVDGSFADQVAEAPPSLKDITVMRSRLDSLSQVAEDMRMQVLQDTRAQMEERKELASAFAAALGRIGTQKGLDSSGIRQSAGRLRQPRFSSGVGGVIE
mmetsp:Transcript_60501/g.139555  ORF Transcript_60501/g.139555 Transcript_60501/m.139555 type:complete len:561 (+) Transcript_60501:265-1947(+)